MEPCDDFVGEEGGVEAAATSAPVGDLTVSSVAVVAVEKTDWVPVCNSSEESRPGCDDTKEECSPDSRRGPAISARSNLPAESPRT